MEQRNTQGVVTWDPDFEEKDIIVCGLAFISAYVMIIIATAFAIFVALLMFGYVAPIVATVTFSVMLYCTRSCKETFKSVLSKWGVVVFLWVFAGVSQEFLIPWWNGLAGIFAR